MQVEDVGAARPRTVRAMVAQFETKPEDWISEQGLLFPSPQSKEWGGRIEDVLALASRHVVDLVVLPELCAPSWLIPRIRRWSQATGCTVVAGSHYYRDEDGLKSRSPIVCQGRLLSTEKSTPAPLEVSPIVGLGLCPSSQQTLVRNSPAGTLAVLICSDYLDPAVRATALAAEPDIVCVVAFQRDSSLYHARMNSDCEESEDGVYILYANSLQAGVGDGKSAVFALMDRMYSDGLRAEGVTDGNPRCKAIEAREGVDAIIVDLDIRRKRPSIPRTVHTRPNVRVVSHTDPDGRRDREFLARIGRGGDRYARLRSLFVEPREYTEMLRRLETDRLLFIVGDPGIGKTYTAVRLLRQYSDRGFEPTWFAGLDREDRRVQCQTLEGFQPQNGQVIYFEDPFGRSIFERRDTIRNVFGPLRDQLRDSDARVIVTSRKEVFERFAEESILGEELRRFTEEMSVVRPSYDNEALKEILRRLAEDRTAWFAVPSCVAIAHGAIDTGHLNTPLAIYDLVSSTENLVAPEELAQRIARRQNETLASFTEDVLACHLDRRIALVLVFLCGFRSRAKLASWFQEVAVTCTREAGGDGTDIGSFSDAVRPELGYRVEPFGANGKGLRFTHPSYEEAVARSICSSASMLRIAGRCMLAIGQVEFPGLLSGITRQARTHPDTTYSLLEAVAQQVNDQGSEPRRLMIAMALVTSHGKSGDARFIELLRSHFDLEYLGGFLGDKPCALGTVGSALRVIENYGIRVLYPDKSRHLARAAVRDQLVDFIDWPRLYSKMLDQPWNCKTPLLDSLSILHPSGRPGRFAFEFVDYLLDQPESSAARFFYNAPKPAIEWLAARSKGRRRKRFDSYQPLAEKPRREVLMDLAASGAPISGVVVDKGAAEALRSGYNLLPVGVAQVMGSFVPGDFICVRTTDGSLLGVGVADYSSAEVSDVAGHHSSQIADILGRYAGQHIVDASRLALV